MLCYAMLYYIILYYMISCSVLYYMNSYHVMLFSKVERQLAESGGDCWRKAPAVAEKRSDNE